jgi:hypothetical protein
MRESRKDYRDNFNGFVGGAASIGAAGKKFGRRRCRSTPKIVPPPVEAKDTHSNRTTATLDLTLGWSVETFEADRRVLG